MGNAAVKGAAGQAAREAAAALRDKIAAAEVAAAGNTVKAVAQAPLAAPSPAAAARPSPLLQRAPAPSRAAPAAARATAAAPHLTRTPDIQPLDLHFVDKKGKRTSAAPAGSAAAAEAEAEAAAEALEARRRKANELPFQSGGTAEPVNTPLNAEAAEVAARVSSQHGDATTVTVQRVMASGPAVEGAEAAQIHEKSEETVRNVMTFDGHIIVGGDTSAGARSFAVWQALQHNPALLDTPTALAASSTAQAALKALRLPLLAQPPAAAVLGAGAAAPKALPAIDSSGKPTDTSAATAAAPGAAAAAAAVDSSSALVPLTESQFESALALAGGGSRSLEEFLLHDTATTAPWVPVKPKALRDADEVKELVTALASSSSGAGADGQSGRSSSALVAADSLYNAPTAVQAWGPRPPEAGPYDQLMLSSGDEEFMMEPGEVFELLARHKANPGYWTAERLAEYLGTQAEWVRIILQHVSAPVFVRVDGEAYGVYDVRPLEDFEKME